MIKATIMALTTACMLCSCIGGTPPGISETQQKITYLHERALVNADKGNLQDAEQLLQESLRLATSLDDMNGQTTTLLLQARLARHAGNGEQASRLVEPALALSKKQPLYADAAQEKSLQELSAGHLDAAHQWAETALHAEQGDLQGRRLNLLARIAFLQDRFVEAAGLAERALATTGADFLAEERANALRLLGMVRLQQRLIPEAERLLEQALHIDKALELPNKIAADLDALANASGQKGDTAQQIRYQQRARGIRENNLQTRSKSTTGTAP